MSSKPKTVCSLDVSALSSGRLMKLLLTMPQMTGMSATSALSCATYDIQASMPSVTTMPESSMAECFCRMLRIRPFHDAAVA